MKSYKNYKTTCDYAYIFAVMQHNYMWYAQNPLIIIKKKSRGFKPMYGFI